MWPSFGPISCVCGPVSHVALYHLWSGFVCDPVSCVAQYYVWPGITSGLVSCFGLFRLWPDITRGPVSYVVQLWNELIYVALPTYFTVLRCFSALIKKKVIVDKTSLLTTK